tara:strand:- start:997 stop:1131 length:135 start_codon:yes stop_codon:yes gene_type:complete
MWSLNNMNPMDRPLLLAGVFIAAMFILGLFTQSSESAEILGVLL